jgi:hypothetical protein
MSMKNKAGLGLAVHWLQQVLISADEGNCPLRPAKKGKKSLRWTTEIESLRREVRRLLNRCWANNKSHSWELYREAQWRYRKEVRKASKETWRTFHSSVQDLPRSARLHRATKFCNGYCTVFVDTRRGLISYSVFVGKRDSSN